MKKGPNAVDITADELREMYWGSESASLRDIANQLGVSREAVRRWFIHFDIPIKPRGTLGFKKMVAPILRDKDWLASEMESKTVTQIAEELGTRPDIVSYWIQRHGLHDESKSVAVKKGLSKAFPDGRFGEKASRWKGGRRITEAGYIRVFVPDHPQATAGAVFEHRLVMEAMLGRYLEPGEIVHHINGVRDDNRPENLELTDQRNHISDHFKASHEVTKLRKENEELKAKLALYEEKYGLLD